MRIFLICLLAVGAIAADSTKKTTLKKHTKRGLLNGDHGAQFYGGQQFGGYVQSGYQHGHQSGPVSSYTPEQTYTYPSLPVGQHQTYTSGSYDNGLGQNLVQNVGQSYDLSAGYQGQQSQHGNYGYSNGVTGQPIEHTHVVNHQAHLSYSAPQPVLVNLPVPVPTPQPYPAQYPVPIPVIPQPLPAPASYQEPLNVGHQQEYASGNGATYDQGSFQDTGAAYYRNTANGGGLEQQSTGSHLGGYEHVDAGNQQYNFGGQESYAQGAPLENTYGGSYKTATYEQHDVETIQANNGVSESHSSGYHYDKPTKPFNF